jgi:hypothetical protein
MDDDRFLPRTPPQVARSIELSSNFELKGILVEPVDLPAGVVVDLIIDGQGHITVRPIGIEMKRR